MNYRELPRKFTLQQFLLAIVFFCGICGYFGVLGQILRHDNNQSISETTLILKVPLIVAMIGFAGFGLYRATSRKK